MKSILKSFNKGYCTWFFNEWFAYDREWLFRRINLSEICEKHDAPKEGCSSTAFAKELWGNRVVGGLPIFIVASIACWVKYPFKQIKRL